MGARIARAALAAMVAICMVALLLPAGAGAGTGAQKAKSACIERTIGRLHIQLGYCP